MASGADYDAQLREVTAGGASTDAAYWDLVCADIEHAADVLRPIYDRLDLGGFEENLPALQEYLASVEGHERNRYTMTPEMHEQVTRRWSKFIEQYGYGKPNETQSRRAG